MGINYQKVLSKDTDAEKLIQMMAEAMKLALRLDNGRDYLMRTKHEDINVGDCLEAFGYTKDGLNEK